jgi:hypothetical protein
MSSPFEGMMSEDVRLKMRKQLIESYKPRIQAGVCCAMCNSANVLLAMHVLEHSIDENLARPAGFVPMSSSMGRIRGCFPVCTNCAPVCGKCHLPIPTESVLEFGHGKNARTGLGICEHIHWGAFFHALIKKMFKKGRFSTTP